MEGGEDPFVSLITFCQPTSSQELKLNTVRFARETETFPDAFDSLGSSFSPVPTQSPPQGIIMVSLSESEDEDAVTDKNAPPENEEFQTPPEEHLVSSLSSQEDPYQNLKPISAVDEKVEMERETVVDRNGDTEAGMENLGVSETDKTKGGKNEDMGENCLEREDNDIAGELKEFGVSEGESEEPVSKKIRVCKENQDSVMHTIQVEGAQIIGKTDNDDDELINLDIEESDEETGMNEDKISIHVYSEEEFGDIDDDDEVSNHGAKGKTDCNSNKELEVENIRTGSPHVDFSNPREKEGIHLDNGDMSVLRNGDLALEEPEEGLRTNEGGKLGEYGREVLGCMNVEDIDAFKYNGDVNDNGDNHWKEVMRRRRELPLSLRERGQDIGRKGDIGNPGVKNLSWNKFLDAAAVLLKKVDYGSEDLDFLERAKRRGMTIPQPRWK